MMEYLVDDSRTFPIKSTAARAMPTIALSKSFAFLVFLSQNEQFTGHIFPEIECLVEQAANLCKIHPA